MFIQDSTGFIVVNNSAKIEVVKIPSFKKIRTIVIAGSFPRNFLPINDSIAYVSELYAKKIWVVNYISGNVVSNITTTGWTEKMILLNGNVFVQQKKVSTDNSTTNAVLKINAATNSIVDSKNFLSRDVSGMASDELGNIWLALDEDTLAGYKTSLLCFNQSLGLVKALPHLANGHHLSQLNIDIARNKVLYTDNDIYFINTRDTVLSNSVFIPLSGKNIYAVSEDWKTGDIYLSDALDYVQQSHIYRYNKFGDEIHSFTAGIISGNFTFNNE